MAARTHFHTVIVGGGQAGLATGYYLKQTGADYLILDAGARPGDPWRSRWDSLRLFTPAQFNGLPGDPFPQPDFTFPTKDEVADYLDNYAQRFALPLKQNTRVEAVSKPDGEFILEAGSQRYYARNIILATGPYQRPSVPTFASLLNPSVVQMHSSAYRNPAQVPDGPVLVVGAGNSGGEIAIELAQHGHQVSLSGRSVGRIPADTLGRINGGKPYWFFLSRVLSVRTPMGRKVREKALHSGTPWIRLTRSDITRAGVVRCPKVKDIARGLPELEDGRLMDVRSVIWATGYKPDYGWVKLKAFDYRGLPVHQRGVAEGVPGLYFVGLHFQTALSSALLGGVGEDARYIVDTLMAKDQYAPAAVGSEVRAGESLRTMRPKSDPPNATPASAPSGKAQE